MEVKGAAGSFVSGYRILPGGALFECLGRTGSRKAIPGKTRLTGKGFPDLFTNRGSVVRSEEHTSELQSLMRISYAVFCLKKKIHKKPIRTQSTNKDKR